jgi:hypothetical protein
MERKEAVSEIHGWTGHREFSTTEARGRKENSLENYMVRKVHSVRLALSQTETIGNFFTF